MIIPNTKCKGGIAMLMKNSPFEARADFLRRSVCDFPQEMTPAAAGGADGEEIVAGLRYLRQLLLDIYADTAVYRVEDDLDSYHRLTRTVLFLQLAGAHGTLEREGEISFLRLDKALIRKHFKMPAAFYLQALMNYGFYFEYFKNGRPSDTYQTCDTVCMFCESCSSFFPALACFCGRIPVMDSKRDYAMAFDLFAMADYATVFLGGKTRKEDIDPLRPDILRALGPKAALWQELVSVLINERGMKASCKFWSYCTPQWIIHFARKGVGECIFTLHTDIVFFEMSAPLQQLAAMAQAKKDLDPVLLRGIETFGGIKCGRCDGGGITMVNGIALCPREPWARRFFFEVASGAEARAIFALARP